MSGVERGGRLRLLTLTSSPQSPPDIHRSFRKVVKRLKRRNLLTGYIQIPELTVSGLAHKHVLFRGSFIEQAFLSALWQQIHNARVVDIRAVHAFKSKRHLASYLAKYLSKSGHGRFSWDWGWVWRGFCGHWQQLKSALKTYTGSYASLPLKSVLVVWRHFLRQRAPPEPGWLWEATGVWEALGGLKVARLHS